jgi:hypothetical protein
MYRYSPQHPKKENALAEIQKPGMLRGPLADFSRPLEIRSRERTLDRAESEQKISY